MKVRRLIAVLAMLSLGATVGMAGSQDLHPYTLFGGSNVDSTEKISVWIPVRGASRIIIRTWSAKAAFHASTDADSTFSDSIAVFKVAFTDSLRNSNPAIAGDSTVITTATVSNVDTTSKMVAVMHPPLQEALRGPGNGSGIMTWVMPVTPGLATADNNGIITTQYMRVLITPLRRMTAGTSSAVSAGKRVNGLKGLRMIAYVYRVNQ